MISGGSQNHIIDCIERHVDGLVRSGDAVLTVLGRIDTLAVRNRLRDFVSDNFARLDKFTEVMMIGVLTHHWATEENLDEARKLLDRNGEAQSKAPGFISRQTLYALTDPAKITTLVIWESSEIYDAWRASPERAAVMGDAATLWSRHTESERFEVAN